MLIRLHAKRSHEPILVETNNILWIQQDADVDRTTIVYMIGNETWITVKETLDEVESVYAAATSNSC